MIQTLLIVLVVLILLGALPQATAFHGMGYGPSSGLTLILIIILILFFVGPRI